MKAPGLRVCLLWFATSAASLAFDSPWHTSVELRAREALLRRELGTLPIPPVSQQSERIGWHSQFSPNPQATKWLQVDLGNEEAFDSVTVVPVDVSYGMHPGPGFGFPVRFRVETSNDTSFSEPRLLAALDGEDFPNPGDAPVFLPTPHAKGRYVRVTATRLWPRGDLALFALGEVIVLRGASNLAAGATVTVSDAYNNPPTWQPSNATDGQTVLGAPVEVMPAPGNGWHAKTVKIPDSIKWVGVDLGGERTLDEVRFYPARPKDFPARRGFGFPVRFRVETALEPDFHEPVVVFDAAQEDFVNPAENPVVIPVRGAKARCVRIVATQLWSRTNDYIFALAELEVWANGENVARSAEVIASESIEAASWKSRFLIDGFNSQGCIVPLPDWLRGLSRRREIEEELRRITTNVENASRDLNRRLIAWASALAITLAAGAGLWLRRRTLARRREVEQLRQRIASDLHDEIGSNLGSIALLSQMALRQPAEAQSDLAEIHRVARATADSMRDLVWFIRPSAPGAEDFVTKLKETAGTMLVGIEWTFTGNLSADRWSLEFKRQVFLILKEALHNVQKHSGASRVDILLEERNGLFAMSVADNGSGFLPEVSTLGHGLISMRQRAETLGGTLDIQPTGGQGTSLSLKVKLTSQDRSPAS